MNNPKSQRHKLIQRLRFVAAHWSDADNGDTLCVLLPKLVMTGVLAGKHGKDGFVLPRSWQDQIVSKFEGLEVKPFPEQASASLYDPDPKKWVDRCLPKYNALLEVLECTVVHPATNARIAEILLRKLKLALRPDFSAAPEEAHFIVGRGFNAILKMNHGDPDASLRPLLHAKIPDYGRLPDFLEALLAYETKNPRPNESTVSKAGINHTPSPSDDGEDTLIAPLISNLSTSSPELRLLSLRLLEHFYSLDHPSVKSTALTLMIIIEQRPFDAPVSMHIRKLAILYREEPVNSWLLQAIPSFCFGLFTVKLAQLWDLAIDELKEIAKSPDGEKIIAELAFKWLEEPSWRSSAQNADQQQNQGLTDFECSNLIRLDRLAQDSASGVLKSRDTMLNNFAKAQELVDERPSSARSQALRVLSAVPHVAEKRSRILVPMFLSWADQKQDDENHLKPEEEENDQSHEFIRSDWTRKDQKSQLELFGLFSNSGSLYKAEEVYEALLCLLANGDLEIQKSALKAIFAWKSGSIKPYQENLLNLLDEARFKEEIAILLQGETLVQSEHRQELMPVLLRILYGRTIARRGIESGKQGQTARRLMVLRHLSIGDFGLFLDIALGDLKEVQLVRDGQLQESALGKQVMRVEKQTGFVKMMEVVLKELGTKVVPFLYKLLDPILYCLIYASRRLQNHNDESKEETRRGKLIKFKDVRQSGLKCLTLLFANADANDWTPYINIIMQEVVAPRLSNLPAESAEGVSGILELFHTWSESPHSVSYLGEQQILSRITDCLTRPKTKVKVKQFVLDDIINNVVCVSGFRSLCQH